MIQLKTSGSAANAAFDMVEYDIDFEGYAHRLSINLVFENHIDLENIRKLLGLALCQYDTAKWERIERIAHLQQAMWLRRLKHINPQGDFFHEG
jgi:hypothetical protein